MDIMLAMGAQGVTASHARRTLSGTVVKYGEYGLTSMGKLKVRPGALRFPDDLPTVKLTREHDLSVSRGHLSSVIASPTEVRASLRVADGPEGDEALREAGKDPVTGEDTPRVRDGLSFHIVDATIDGDEITDGRVVAVGQVGVPAYESGRIDSIAAAHHTGGTMTLTPEQTARLTELRASTTLSDAETMELNALATLAGEDAPATPAEAPAEAPTVAASMPSVPAGSPAPGAVVTAPARTERPKGAALQEFCQQITAGLQARVNGDAQGGLATITAALSDITNTAHKGIIEPPAWSGELWSGLVYEPLFLDLFNSGDLTSWEGSGWRFTNKLTMADYAGDKAAIPTDTIGTEASTYEAARQAVGVDIDRKFFDFPNQGFVEALFAQARESWTINMDSKAAAYLLANDVPAKDVEPGGAALDPQTSLLKAAGVAIRALKRRKVGKATFVIVNDEDLFSLMDLDVGSVPAFLELFDIDPSNFRSAPEGLVPSGTVLAGVKQAATFRTLPGSPIRVEAQDLTKGGIDEAFFGYWAIEEHHTSAIASAEFDPEFVPA